MNTLNCKDSFGDGWNGGTISVGGSKYCGRGFDALSLTVNNINILADGTEANSATSGGSTTQSITCPASHEGVWSVVVVHKQSGGMFRASHMQAMMEATFKQSTSDANDPRYKLLNKTVAAGGWCENTWIDRIEFIPITAATEASVVDTIYSLTNWSSVGGTATCNSTTCKYEPGKTLILAEAYDYTGLYRKLLSGATSEYICGNSNVDWDRATDALDHSDPPSVASDGSNCTGETAYTAVAGKLTASGGGQCLSAQDIANGNTATGSCWRRNWRYGKVGSGIADNNANAFGSDTDTISPNLASDNCVLQTANAEESGTQAQSCSESRDCWGQSLMSPELGETSGAAYNQFYDADEYPAHEWCDLRPEVTNFHKDSLGSYDGRGCCTTWMQKARESCDMHSACGHAVLWLGNSNMQEPTSVSGSDGYGSTLPVIANWPGYSLVDGDAVEGTISPYQEVLLDVDAAGGQTYMAGYVCDSVGAKDDLYVLTISIGDSSRHANMRDAFLDELQLVCSNSLGISNEETKNANQIRLTQPASADEAERVAELTSLLRYHLVQEPRTNVIWCASDDLAIWTRDATTTYFASFDMSIATYILGYGGTSEAAGLVSAGDMTATIDDQTGMDSNGAFGDFLLTAGVVVDHFMVTGALETMFSIKTSTNLLWYDPETQIRNRIFTGYNPAVSPTSVSLEVGYELLSVPEVSSDSQSLTTYFMIKEMWVDTRLGYVQSLVSQLGSIEVNCDEVWTPTFKIKNKLPTEDYWTVEDDCILYGGAVGSTIFRQRKMKTTTSCKMDLAPFPFDDQECDTEFQWSVNATFNRDPDVAGLACAACPGNLPGGFAVDHTVPGCCVQDLKRGFENTKFKIEMSKKIVSSPGFPAAIDGLTVTLDLLRKPQWFIFNVIIPQLLITMMGFFQFWLPPAAVPARAGVMLLSILNTMNARASVGRMLPQNGDMSWLDIYMFYNLWFLVLAAVLSVWSVDLNRRGVVIKGYMDKKIAASIWANLEVAHNHLERLKSHKTSMSLSKQDLVDEEGGIAMQKKNPGGGFKRASQMGKNVAVGAMGGIISGVTHPWRAMQGKTNNETIELLQLTFEKYDDDKSGFLVDDEIATAMADLLPRGLIKSEDLKLFVRDRSLEFRSSLDSDVKLDLQSWIIFMLSIKPNFYVTGLSLLFGDVSTNLADKIGRRYVTWLFMIGILALVALRRIEAD